MASRCHAFTAYGLQVESDFALPGAPAASDAIDRPRVAVRIASPAELENQWSGSTGSRAWSTLADQTAVQLEIGTAGDQRLTYGSTLFHVSSDGATVLCAPENLSDPAWQRHLLDTVLWSASFANGFELLHASAVECARGVVAFIAKSGGGKTSILAELLHRGHRLFCDDVLALSASSRGGILCHPGPAVMNLPNGIPPAYAGGTMIARFRSDNERWVTVKEAATSPNKLTAVCLIDRCSSDSDADPVATPTVLNLLSCAISLPHTDQRARERFRLFSLLAEEVDIYRLTTVRRPDPTELADLVESSLRISATARQHDTVSESAAEILSTMGRLPATALRAPASE